MGTIVEIVDGRPKGYISLPELAKKYKVKPAAIRINILRGNIHPLTIGYDKSKTHWFPENYILPSRQRGRPRKEKTDG